MNKQLIDLLRCPVDGSRLTYSDRQFVSNTKTYQVEKDFDIPIFADQFISKDAKVQQAHYDKAALSKSYINNVTCPCSKEYIAYLYRMLTAHLGNDSLGSVAEICCGLGMGFDLIQERIEQGVGVDISLEMLKLAKRKHKSSKIQFVQGDATNLPLASNSFDNVIMLGGIHHINDRKKLFSEVFRILKPGGRFLFLDPVNDFILWRSIRKIIYRVSSKLNEETEHPLLYNDTVPVLEKVGFNHKHWRTHGFFGFCIFMNNDVLIFNRIFRFIPGSRYLARLSTKFDEAILHLPGMSRNGLQVVGVAEKPKANAA